MTYLLDDSLVVMLEDAVEHGGGDLDEVLPHVHRPLQGRDAGAARHVFDADRRPKIRRRK